MKLLRISASLLAFSAFTVLTACGGGGGGSTTPPTNGGGPPPTSSSPTPTPTATPAPTSSPSGGNIGTSSQIVNAADGVVNGTDNWQTNGATTSDPGDGDTATGANGSNTIDGLGCSLSSEQMAGGGYHVHSFVGIMVNGTEYAIPDAIGMNQPTSDEPITNFTCAYSIHTHGASGIVHVEDPTMAQNYSATPAQYNLQSLFDIWGQSLAALPINGISAAPQIYVGTPSGKRSCSCAQNGDDLVNSYTLYTGSPTSLLLTHHTAIWLVYGTPPSAGLPQIDFGISS